MVVRQGSNIILLDGRLRCSAMHKLEEEDGQNGTECPLCVIRVIRRDGRAIGQADAIKLLQMTNTFTAIVFIERSFLSVKKTVLNYAGALMLHYGVAFAKAHIKDKIGETMLSRPLHKESHSSYIWCVKLGQLMARNARFFLLLKSLNGGWEYGKELGMSPLDRVVLYATQASFYVLLIEATGFYINKNTKFTTFYAPSFYCFGEQLPLNH